MRPKKLCLYCETKPAKHLNLYSIATCKRNEFCSMRCGTMFALAMLQIEEEERDTKQPSPDYCEKHKNHHGGECIVCEAEATLARINS